MSESYNALIADKPFSPLSLGVSIGRPIQIRGDISYNKYSHNIETINSEMNMNLGKVTILLGERFNKVAHTMNYDFGANYPYSKNLFTEARLWYDAKGGGVRDASLKVRYQKQCWGMTMALNRKPSDPITKRPSDYSIVVTFDLLGFGSHPL